ncbi:hypothetical protein ACFPRL_03690 [Pseudoclavibacter helvolus]
MQLARYLTLQLVNVGWRLARRKRCDAARQSPNSLRAVRRHGHSPRPRGGLSTPFCGSRLRESLEIRRPNVVLPCPRAAAAINLAFSHDHVLLDRGRRHGRAPPHRGNKWRHRDISRACRADRIFDRTLRPDHA